MSRLRSCLLVLFFFLATNLWASTPAQDWTQSLQEVTLPNGMKFILLPWGESPIVSVYIRFRVGGLDEDEGQTGLAHFLEHMAFKGTKTIGTRNYPKEAIILQAMDAVGEKLAEEVRKGEQGDEKIKAYKAELKRLRKQQEPLLVREELSRLFVDQGAQDMNATTTKDMTSYFVSLPSEKLPFWAKLECSRIFYPVFREFYEERDVILEERRMRVDNNPEGRLYQELMAHAYTKNPYRWPTIGVAQDLLTLTRPILDRFWHKYYVPQNAVGVIVGRFQVGPTAALLRQTFGQVPRGTLFHKKIIEEPPQQEERRFEMKDRSKERLSMAYHKPTLPDEDDYLFDLFSTILADGRSSRLYKKLVLDKKTASSVSSYSGAPGSRLPNLFVISANPISGHHSEENLRLIDEELTQIATTGISERELANAKNHLLSDMIWKLESNEGMAEQISYFEGLGNGWRYLKTYADVIGKFQVSDIQRLVKKHLIPSNRTVGIMRP